MFFVTRNHCDDALARMQDVANHDLMAVAHKRRASLAYEEICVGFELRGRLVLSLRKDGRMDEIKFVIVTAYTS